MQGAAFAFGRRTALSQGVAKARKREVPDEEPSASTLTSDELALLRGWLKEINGRRYTYRDERVRTPSGLAIVAGDINPSTWYGWLKNLVDPRLFHFRRYLNAVGLDVKIVPKGVSVGPTTLVGLTGDEVNDDTKDMVLLMETLPEHARKSLLRLAITSAKLWGAEPSSVQAPEAENGSVRLQDKPLDPPEK